jgi:hypothetical protein
MAWYLVEKNVVLRLRQQAAEGPAGRLRIDAGALANGFLERLLHLVRRAQELAPVVLVAKFAQRARAGQDADEQRAACVTHVYYMPYMDHAGLVAGFAAYNGAIRSVAARTGALLAAGEDGIPSDPQHFTDSVHLTDAGCRWQAARVAGALESAAAFQALFERDTGGR